MPPPVSDVLPLVDALVEIEQTMPGMRNVYPLRPRGNFDGPAIFNMLGTGRMTPVDTLVDQDEVIIRACIGVRHTDAQGEMRELLQLADTFRELLDVALKNAGGPLGGADARRVGMTQSEHEFGAGPGAIPVLAIEFPIRVRLENAHAAQF